MLYGLDFETGVDKDGNAVLLLCCLNSKKDKVHFKLYEERDFTLFYYMITCKSNTYVVFNASFDIEIIITILLKNGWTFLREDEDVRNKSMKLLMGQKIYKLTLYRIIKGKVYENSFIDLANIIVGEKLRDVAETYTNLHKGEYDKASKASEEEFIEYCMQDSKITREAYENVSNLLDIKKLITIGGAAFNIMLNMNFKGINRNEKFHKFKQIYGDMTIEEDDHIRNWYAGGFGWCSTDERTETNINSYDITSAYPYECLGRLPTYNYHKKVQGILLDPNERYPFVFVHLKITGQVKPNYCPIKPTRNIYGDSNKYIYDNDDVYLIREYGKKDEYDFFMENTIIDDIIVIESIAMKEAKRNPLKKFVEKYYELKKTSTGVRKDMAKRILNSLTGKLGTNPHKYNQGYKLENNVLVKDFAEEVFTDTYATHVVSVITSRVRCKCYEVDSKIRDTATFRLYATDSVKHSSDCKIIETGDKLGDWKLEKENMDFIFLGLKAYIFDPYNKQGKREVLCAGISKDYKDKITNDEFYANAKVKSMISVRRGNGRVIYEGEKHIANPVKKPRSRKELEEWLKENRLQRTKKQDLENK